jgi:predicted nucleotidyltransferase component of viral defense system
MLYTKCVDPKTLELLSRLTNLPFLQDFYLVGGTALALYFGHRKSIDLDLFTNSDVDWDALNDEILTIGAWQSFHRRKRIYQGYLESVKVDFVHYPYLPLNPINHIEGFRLISIEDIAAMKLSAVTGRGTKKDFFDIHLLLQSLSLAEMVALFDKKFPEIGTFHVLRSLTWFEDAEKDLDPELFEEVSWYEVKAFIKMTVNAYLKSL